MSEQSTPDIANKELLDENILENIEIFEDIEEDLTSDFLQLLEQAQNSQIDYSQTDNGPIYQPSKQAELPASSFSNLRIFADPDADLLSSTSTESIIGRSNRDTATEIRSGIRTESRQDSFFENIYQPVNARGQQPQQPTDNFILITPPEVPKPDYTGILDGGFDNHAKGTPSDPALITTDFWHGWQLTGEYGLNVQDVWLEYTGEGVDVAVFDDGVNRTHSELSANYDTSRDYDVLDNDNDAISTTEADSHGTRVSMMIAADDNGSQGLGVAYDSTIIGIRRGYGNSLTSDTLDGFEHALSSGAEIMNNSWGTTGAFGDHVDGSNGDVHPAMQDLVQNGRGGLGTAIVFSAGNSNEDGLSANYKNYQNSIHTITVGASEEDGTIASFSEWGSNVLLSAPGANVRLPYTLEGYAIDDNGTSFSAPAVSGVIALMLEANPDLGYRDIQEILAISSRQTDINDSGWQTNGATNWNGGGLTFNHDFGFGIADAHAAVRIAETWTKQQIYTNMTSTSNYDGASLSIPSTGTVSTTINVTQDIEIEHAVIYLDIVHARAGDLVISLISPDGTESILVDRIDNGSYYDFFGILNGFWFDFSSVAHWGETSQGTWTLEIQDVVSGNSGTLLDWDLQFFGNTISTDDIYTYTEDFSLFSGSLGSRATLNDTNGGTDTINAAAVTSDTTVDLANGTATIDGQNITVSGIEDVYTGDGDDTITGDSADNVIWGGRGADTIDGGDGNDTASWLHNISEYTFDLASDVISVIRSSVEDLISNIETFIFDETSYSRTDILTIIFDEQGNAAPELTVSDTTLSADQSILVSTIASANDADGHTLSYTIHDGNSSATSAHFELNGSELTAGQDHVLSATEFASLRIVAGTDNSSDTLTITASDGVLSDTETITITTEFTNTPPAIVATDTTILSESNILASTVFDVSDQVNNGLTYFIIDQNTLNNSAHLDLNGSTLSAGIVHELTQAEFDALRIVGGQTDLSEIISLQVTDGSFVSSWAEARITTDYNDAPTLNVQNTTLPNNSSIFASSVITAADVDSPSLSYTIHDENSALGSAYLELNGSALAAGQDHVLTSLEFANLRIIGAQASTTDDFTVSVSDGNTATSDSTLTITSVSIPTITASDITLGLGETALASTVISASDADGDAITYYVLDTSNGANTGYYQLSGLELAARQSHELTATEFASLQIVGGSAETVDNLWVLASDGTYTTGWTRFKLFSEYNETPDLIVDDTTVDSGKGIFLSTLVDASDPDNDVLTFTVSDANSSAGSAVLSLSGNVLNAGEDHVLSLSQFNNVRVQGGSSSSTDNISVQISDGTTSSDVETITITTNAPNATPTLNVSNTSIELNASILASSIISANDTDGDTLTYQILDRSNGANSAYFQLSGSELAADTIHILTAAEFASLQIIGGSVEAYDQISVRVSDGSILTFWKDFYIDSMQFDAPTISMSDTALQSGQRIFASTITSVADTDTHLEQLSYTVRDSNADAGSGYFQLNGSALNANQDYVLSAGDYANLRIVAGSSASTDTLSVTVSDGVSSESDTFTLTTSAVNTAPTLSTQFNYIEDGITIDAAPLMSGYDADGDALSYYIIDQNADASSGYFTLNGLELAANELHYIDSTELANLAIVGGSSASNNAVLIRATDGELLTGWEKFDIRTVETTSINGNASGNALIGSDSGNVLDGRGGNDWISGGDGLDTLTGGSGADTFYFDAASAFNNIDDITDFNTSEDDAIDISDLLVGFDPTQHAIDDYVRITDDGTNSTIEVDTDGGADSFQTVATISNSTGLTDEAALYSNGNLIA